MVAPFTGTVTIAALRTAFDDTSAQLTTNVVLGSKDFELVLGPITSLSPSTDISLRSIAFTPTDDWQVRALAGDGSADAAGRMLAVALTVDNGDTTWLLDRTISGSTTSVGAGSTIVRQTYTSTSGALWALKGLRHRLAISCDSGTFTSACASIQLRSFRRRA